MKLQSSGSHGAYLFHTAIHKDPHIFSDRSGGGPGRRQSAGCRENLKNVKKQGIRALFSFTSFAWFRMIVTTR
jgi:hypothetical protein